jgi:NAD+ synthase
MTGVVRDLDVTALVTRLCDWLQEEVAAAGAEGAVVGLSGGIDSATVAGLLARALGSERVLGLIMPCHSDPVDAEDARLAAETFHIPTQFVDLSPVYDAFLRAQGVDAPAVAQANLKPRLRMATLYYHAARLGRLVVGTGNRSELEVGYFTKYGDGGVDLLPLGGLLKTEVRAVAQAIGVPDRIVSRPPSAGLWQGQTDEGELGLSYEELDRHLAGERIPAERAARIEELRRRSAHKRDLPPIFRP